MSPRMEPSTILASYRNRKTGETVGIIEKADPAVPMLLRQYVVVGGHGKHWEIECRDRRAAKSRFDQIVNELKDLGRMHPTPDESRDKTLEDLALERVEGDPDLRCYGDKILYGGTEDDARWEWILETPKDELLAWVRTEGYRDGIEAEIREF